MTAPLASSTWPTEEHAIRLLQLHHWRLYTGWAGPRGGYQAVGADGLGRQVSGGRDRAEDHREGDESRPLDTLRGTAAETRREQHRRYNGSAKGLARYRRYAEKRYNERKRAGLCTACGEEPAVGVGGARCWACRDKQWRRENYEPCDDCLTPCLPLPYPVEKGSLDLCDACATKRGLSMPRFVSLEGTAGDAIDVNPSWKPRE